MSVKNYFEKLIYAISVKVNPICRGVDGRIILKWIFERLGGGA
jgi:hypothetical protein